MRVSGDGIGRAATRTKETAGPSTALRSGRDDNSVKGKWHQKRSDEWLLMVPQNCHPDRSAVEGPAKDRRVTNWSGAGS